MYSPTQTFSPFASSSKYQDTYPHRSSGVDRDIHTYSGDLDRGVPTTGLYAQDGIWEEDEPGSEATTTRPSSGSTFGASSKRRQSVKAERQSIQTRMRSGTVGSVHTKEDKGIWAWSKKSSIIPGEPSTPTLPDTNVDMTVTPSIPPKTLEKKQSKSMLRGKGRRGELSVNVSPNDRSEPIEALPCLPPTPASLLSSPALSTASILSPPTYPSRSNLNPEFSPILTPETKPAKSSWRKGMQKLFKSKSAVGLREVFSSVDPNRPPLPETRPPARNVFNKPIPASTSPLSTVRPKRDTTGSFYGKSPLSPPPSSTAESFGLSHPSLPQDPFASSLNLSANSVPSPVLPPKPRLSRHSPSLRDLKQFLAPAKPRLTKAKSLANIQENARVPLSAPPLQTAFSPTEPPVQRIPKRVNSVQLLSTKDRINPTPILARPTLSRLPTESPPLLPPNPPYFPSTLSPRISSAPSTPSGLSTETSLSILSLPPSTPLPALPSSASLSPIGTTPLKKSGSGPVLLPRSRSTSMSLKAPPTSSSFFDLYEQLGIWPTPSEKEETPERSPENKPKQLDSPVKLAPVVTSPVSETESPRFSSESWKAAISAFPVIDIPATSRMDFGMPGLDDEEAPGESFHDLAVHDAGDMSMTSNVAVGGSTCSISTGGHGSSGSVSVSHSNGASFHTARQSSSQGHSGRRIGSSGGGGSNASSGAGSRDERHRGDWFDGGHSVDSSSDEEDDKPLSQIHPEAAAAQQDAIRRRASRKAAKVRAKGRNPGGGVAWDGEGGVPPDVLRRRLEAVIVMKRTRVFDWQLAQGITVPRRRTQTHPMPTLRPERSLTNPPVPAFSVPMVNRSQTVRTSQDPHRVSAKPSPMMGVPERQRRSEQSSVSAGRSDHHSPPESSASNYPAATTVPNVSRSNTTATSRSSASRIRSKASPTTAEARNDEPAHARATTEPIPVRPVGVKVSAFIATVNGARMTLELYPETTAKDVLNAARQRGELSDPPYGLNWVVVEVFAELDYERQVREYEHMIAITKGWDPINRSNCFVFRQSNSAPSTSARGIPSNAPFLGAYVQYETKKGKWSKRYLETRGGQVFISKNDKNKEEVQINTLFHDVYTTSRSSSSPKPFVFVMKRGERASVFENPNDYSHVFCAEESIAWKLVAAIFDAKSHAMAQIQPHLMMSAQVSRRPTVKNDSPLVNIQEKPKERSEAFTGKGLLRI